VKIFDELMLLQLGYGSRALISICISMKTKHIPRTQTRRGQCWYYWEKMQELMKCRVARNSHKGPYQIIRAAEDSMLEQTHI
jgi:gamma-glutamyl phosphate reductase